MKSNTDFANRLAFDTVAESYDQARPTYPAALYQDIISLSRLGPGSSVLEIGAGSGQATLDLAKQGLVVTAIEPGAKLAEIARRKLDAVPTVTVVQEFFEDWTPPENKFDAIVSANAFHWIKPDIAYSKSQEVLKPGGSVALFWNFPSLPNDYEASINEILERFDPKLKTQHNDAHITKALEGGAQELEASGRFQNVIERRYPWSDKLTGPQYVQLLDSYANYAAMDRDKKGRLFDALIDRIDSDFGGVIQLDNFAALRVAQRNPPGAMLRPNITNSAENTAP